MSLLETNYSKRYELGVLNEFETKLQNHNFFSFAWTTNQPFFPYYSIFFRNSSEKCMDFTSSGNEMEN